METGIREARLTAGTLAGYPDSGRPRQAFTDGSYHEVGLFRRWLFGFAGSMAIRGCDAGPRRSRAISKSQIHGGRGGCRPKSMSGDVIGDLNRRGEAEIERPWSPRRKFSQIDQGPAFHLSEQCSGTATALRSRTHRAEGTYSMEFARYDGSAPEHRYRMSSSVASARDGESLRSLCDASFNSEADTQDYRNALGRPVNGS